MLVVLFVTRPLLLIHRGHRLRNIVVIVVLWLFVAMSGASPSAVRAALMLTIVQLALFGSARRNTVNTIAIALALMLIYRPDYLYDISFQLSAAAVIGIVVWGIPLIGHLGHLNPIYRGVVTTVVIGITATLWTLPLISHAFGNIPLIGIVVTPLAMLTAYAVIIFGFATLLLPVAIATPFAMAAEWAAGVQNDIVLRAAEEWWGAVPFTLSEGGVVACYVALLTITLVIWSRKRKKVVSLWEYDDYIRH
jgi:competence protein ComEC